MKRPKIVVIMGSNSDMPTMKEVIALLEEFQVSYELKVLSAHRMPEETRRFAKEAESKGIKVIIAGAGGAAALAGVLASYTSLPVIGVPIKTKSLKGLDSLLSILQMPSGVPVATMAIGKSGARNAAIFALQILGLKDKTIQNKLKEFKKELKMKAKSLKFKGKSKISL